MNEVRDLGAGRYQTWQVFADFCELAALAYQQVPFQDAAREERYLEVVGRYERHEAQAFARMLGQVVAGLEDEPCDFLGAAFQELELSNHWRGQFFTPVALARLCAEVQLDDGLFRGREFVTVNDPACGAGVQLLAFAQAVRAQGVNPQQRMFAIGQDIDETAARMCFIQLALSGIPAAVVIGDTLRLEERAVMLTPAYHLGFWAAKRRRERGAPAVTMPLADRQGQLALGLPESGSVAA